MLRSSTTRVWCRPVGCCRCWPWPSKRACRNLLERHVRFGEERIKSGAANPVGKLTSVLGGYSPGADNILVRGDSAYGNSDVITAVVKTGAKFSFVLAKNPAVNRAISAIPADAWTPVHYPGSVTDPDTGELISDAEVAETTYTAFAATTKTITARLIIRRVKDQNHLDSLFTVWGHTRSSPTTPTRWSMRT